MLTSAVDQSSRPKRKNGSKLPLHPSKLRVERYCWMDEDVRSPSIPMGTLSDLPSWRSRPIWMPTSEFLLGRHTNHVEADDRNEIFGPVLSIVAAETMDEAIEIINANK